MQTKLVSVIIPIYNVERYLRRCVDSVIGQTYPNIEIILINDGSTDSCGEICKEYEEKDARVKYCYHENIGLSGSRNRGLALATGEFITFLDSDDWIELSYIESILFDMLQNSSDIGLCDINYVRDGVDEDRVVKLRFIQSPIYTAQDKSAVNKSRLFAWGKIFKTSLFTDYGIAFPNFAYEDICTPLLTIRANIISYVPNPLINYIEDRRGSLSNVSSNIGDLGKGLVWLKCELVKSELYDDWAVEFKKIALAQLRYAARRFSMLSDEPTKTALQALADVVGDLLPELHGIANRKYYVPVSSTILRLALDRCLPYASQIVDTPDEANSQLPVDEEALKYNMAELLMQVM